MAKRVPSSVAMESISERLSNLETLYFPRALQSSALDSSHRKSLLRDLLSRDVPVFLERYGSQLTSEELAEFDELKEDYEVNWHLNHLRSLTNPSPEEVKMRTAKIKNRRRAYMDKLVVKGQYFSEDAMREREPYLHHEYLGQFQDLTGRRMARPGERWSETLMRRAEERIMVEKIRKEQQRLGVAESDWVVYEREEPQMEEEEEGEEEGEEEEETDDDENEDEETKANGNLNHQQVSGDDKGTLSNAVRRKGLQCPSPEEMEDRMDQFTVVMQQKFMSGEDHQHLDYSKIDEDESLDNHWMKDAIHDEEDKYFDAD